MNMRSRRSGFTLVELAVVLGIMVFLMGLTVAFAPTIYSRANEARGAQEVIGWLGVARQRAVRDQVPTGVRFLKSTDPKENPNGFYLLSSAVYIQQPDDYTGDPLYTDATDAKIVYLDGLDALSGNPADNTLWSIQPGDYLEALGTGLMHRILDPIEVDPSGPMPMRVKLTLNTPLSAPIAQANKTSVYRIMRAPRVISEAPMKLAANLVINVTTNNRKRPFQQPMSYPLPPAFNGSDSVDVLFSPRGEVISPNLTTDKMILWLHYYDPTDALCESPADPMDPSNPLKLIEFVGDPTLLAIYARTGAIAAYTPDSTKASGVVVDPYSLVK